MWPVSVCVRACLRVCMRACVRALPPLVVACPACLQHLDTRCGGSGVYQLACWSSLQGVCMLCPPRTGLSVGAACWLVQCVCIGLVLKRLRSSVFTLWHRMRAACVPCISPGSFVCVSSQWCWLVCAWSSSCFFPSRVAAVGQLALARTMCILALIRTELKFAESQMPDVKAT